MLSPPGELTSQPACVSPPQRGGMRLMRHVPFVTHCPVGSKCFMPPVPQGIVTTLKVGLCFNQGKPQSYKGVCKQSWPTFDHPSPQPGEALSLFIISTSLAGQFETKAVSSQVYGDMSCPWELSPNIRNLQLPTSLSVGCVCVSCLQQFCFQSKT